MGRLYSPDLRFGVRNEEGLAEMEEDYFAASILRVK
jgi:hypothetical protein